MKKREIHWKNEDFLFISKSLGGQGFKTMISFNEVLLAKQVWRLHKNPTSFMAKCLKAKYYPHTDVLKARLGYRPSFAWNSIYHAKWVIRKGGCWKIGNGYSLDV